MNTLAFLSLGSILFSRQPSTTRRGFWQSLGATATAVGAVVQTACSKRSEEPAPAPQASPAPNQPIPIPAWLDRFCNEVTEEFTGTHCSYLPAVEAFHRMARTRPLLVQTPVAGQNIFMAPIVHIERADGGLRTRIDLVLDLPFLEELLRRVQVNPLYRELAVQILVATGARIVDAEQYPQFYIEETTLEAAVNPDPAFKQEKWFTQVFTAHFIEYFAFGQIAAANCLRERGFRATPFNVLAGQESDQRMTLALLLVGRILERSWTSRNYHEFELIVKRDTFLDYMFSNNRSLVAALARTFADMVGEGAAWTDANPSLGRPPVVIPPASCEFLLNPIFVGKPARTSPRMDALSRRSPKIGSLDGRFGAAPVLAGSLALTGKALSRRGLLNRLSAGLAFAAADSSEQNQAGRVGHINVGSTTRVSPQRRPNQSVGAPLLALFEKRR